MTTSGGNERDGTAAAAAAEGTVLLRPAASCPRCGSRPAIRVSPPLRSAAAGRPPEERLATYQCQRRRCGTVYPLTARQLRDAG